MIKVRKAKVSDVQPIFDLVNSSASQGMMLTRSKYKIVTLLNNFSVAEDDTGVIVGCAALTPLWTDMAEIMSLSVSENHRGRGIGKLLVETLIQEAKEKEFPKVISLTYQVEFFKKLGFLITDKDHFPRKLWRECLECPKLEKCDETAMYIDIK